MGSPTDVSNLVLWFRASDLSGLPDATAINTQWSSVVGSATTGQGTAGARPTKQTVSGNTVVRFDGTDDWLNIDNGDALTCTQNKAAVTMFFKAKVNSVPATTGQVIFFSTATQTAIRLYSGIEATTGLQRCSGRRLDGDATASYSGTLGWDTTDVHVQTAIADWANSDHFIYKDGVLSGSNTSWLTAGNSDTTASTGAAFCSQHGTGFYVGCDLYEVVVYDRALNSTERQTVENYLMGISGEGGGPRVHTVRHRYTFT